MEEIGANYIDGNRTDEAIKLVQDFILTGEQAAISEEIAIDYEPQFQWFLFPRYSSFYFIHSYLIK